MRCGAVLDMVIGQIHWSRSPKYIKMALLNATLKPRKLDVDGFGVFLMDGLICNSTGSGVIFLHGCRQLRVAHLFQRLPWGSCLFRIIE